jgi:DNA-binding NarL/FixJ family response regulator
MLFHAGDALAALDTGWQSYQRATGTLGLDRLLIRLAGIATHVGRIDQAHRALTEIDRLRDELGGPDLERIAAQAHGQVLGDREAALTAVKLARADGHLPDLLRACLIAGQLVETPATLLAEAHRIADRLGAGWQRARTRELMRARGITPPRNRAARDAFSGQERRIIELIRDGHTNRRIAAELRISEKTVENHLTRLFARTGLRSRLELAAASLEGRFEEVG